MACKVGAKIKGEAEWLSRGEERREREDGEEAGKGGGWEGRG